MPLHRSLSIMTMLSGALLLWSTPSFAQNALRGIENYSPDMDAVYDDLEAANAEAVAPAAPSNRPTLYVIVPPSAAGMETAMQRRTAAPRSARTVAADNEDLTTQLIAAQMQASGVDMPTQVAALPEEKTLGTADTAAMTTAAARGLGSITRHVEPHPVPEDLSFTKDRQDKPLTLGQFKGKVVVLNLWATWCGPCIVEMPALDRLQAKFGGPTFEVVAVSLDKEGPKAARKFYFDKGIEDLTVYADPSWDMPRALEISNLPVTLILDARGAEVARIVGPADWDSEEAHDFIRKQLKVRKALVERLIANKGEQFKILDKEAHKLAGQANTYQRRSVTPLEAGVTPF